MRPTGPILTLCGALGALAACDRADPPAPPGEDRDPLVQQALFDPLMIDPDLAQQNEAGAALTISFDQSLPVLDTFAQTVAVISNQARLLLLDGGAIPDLPAAAQRRELPRLAADCRPGLEHSAIWAARLPAFAAIVPRGAVQVGVGSDAPPCRVRAVSYRTPLPVEEVMQFHYTLAWRAGLNPRHFRSPSGESAITGANAAHELAVRAAPSGPGLVAVEIVTRERARSGAP